MTNNFALDAAFSFYFKRKKNAINQQFPIHNKCLIDDGIHDMPCGVTRGLRRD